MDVATFGGATFGGVTFGCVSSDITTIADMQRRQIERQRNTRQS